MVTPPPGPPAETSVGNSSDCPSAVLLDASDNQRPNLARLAASLGSCKQSADEMGSGSAGPIKKKRKAKRLSGVDPQWIDKYSWLEITPNKDG